MTNPDKRGYDVETLASAKIYSNIYYVDFNVDYGITTDNGNAQMMQANGQRVEVVPSTSYEYVGENCNENEPGKIIFAKNGNIHLEATNGDIILKAKNIRIVAEDGSGEVTINSGKIVDIRAPYVKENATNMTVTVTGNLDTIAGTKSGVAQIKNCDSSSTDAVQGSFLGPLISSLQSLKKFFEDCGV